jgi:hypothetical protein
VVSPYTQLNFTSNPTHANTPKTKQTNKPPHQTTNQPNHKPNQQPTTKQQNHLNQQNHQTKEVGCLARAMSFLPEETKKALGVTRNV